MLVVAGDADLLERLDKALWEQFPEEFLAHGRADAPHAARQPVLLSSDCTAANGATLVALADGRWRPEAESFERALLFFDEAGRTGARETWRLFDQRDDVTREFHELDGGKWVRRAWAGLVGRIVPLEEPEQRVVPCLLVRGGVEPVAGVVEHEVLRARDMRPLDRVAHDLELAERHVVVEPAVDQQHRAVELRGLARGRDAVEVELAHRRAPARATRGCPRGRSSRRRTRAAGPTR